MKTGTFIAEVDSHGKLDIPSDIRERLTLAEGDKVEISLKKIRSKRQMIILKNPLYKILDLAESKEMVP